MKRLLRRWALGLLVVSVAGCAEVKPWQKEALAQPYMQAAGSRESESFLQHSLITVEQAEGGDGSAGGGCGCR